LPAELIISWLSLRRVKTGIPAKPG
jgi:hypothetical protein